MPGMLREKLFEHQDPIDGFRWRSHEITRIEGFSDAVFGFAVTLLIVSLEVPRTSTELFATMRGFGAFLVTFVMLVGIWHAQYTYFRRYGLEDRVTVVLNLTLLFTVLFFVYPLKFLFTMMIGDPTLRHAKVMTAHGLEAAILPEHRPWIFVIFAAGFVAIFTIFVLLYRHAHKFREKLGLNEFELFETEHTIRRMKLAVIIGAAYLGVAAMEMLPHRTPAEKRTLTIASLTMMVIFLGMMVKMIGMVRHRRRVTKEWLARNENGGPPRADV
jgi:uncharacterized membrane protein